jgi:hypothetical protein
MKRWMVLGLAMWAGCGSDSNNNNNNNDAGSNGPGTFNGTVRGKGLSVKDAVFGIINDGSSASNSVIVILADRASLCAAISANPAPTGATTGFGFGLANVGLLGVTPLATGTYTFASSPTLGAGKVSVAVTYETLQGCTVDTNSKVFGTGGSVTVTQVGNAGGTNLHATYSMQFNSDSVSGSVNATYCAALSTTTPPCAFLRTPPSPVLE